MVAEGWVGAAEGGDAVGGGAAGGVGAAAVLRVCPSPTNQTATKP